MRHPDESTSDIADMDDRSSYVLSNISLGLVKTILMGFSYTCFEWICFECSGQFLLGRDGR